MATSFLGFLFALCTMTGCEKKSSNPETPASADNESPQESLPLSEGPGRGSLARRTLRTAASAARANSPGPAALLTPAHGGRGLAPETPARGGRAPAPRDPAGVLVTAAPGERRCKGRRDGLSRPGTDGVTCLSSLHDPPLLGQPGGSDFLRQTSETRDTCWLRWRRRWSAPSPLRPGREASFRPQARTQTRADLLF